MTPVSKVFKHPLELALSSSAAKKAARHRIRGKCLILAYHGVIPEGEPAVGERALFVPQADFGAQLDVLASFADVTPLDRIDEPQGCRPRVAITFDDAYGGAVREGVQELVSRGLPATIFVAPGRLNGHVFWWDALARPGDSLDESIRSYALYTLGGSEERVRGWAKSVALASCDTLEPYAQTATTADLHAAVEFPGITVGSHTWSHANLSSLSATDIAAEIEHSRAWLREQFGEKALPWIAYPYGIHNPEIQIASAKAGYIGGLGIKGGWHCRERESPLARPRLNVPAHLSISGFSARLFGSVPLAGLV